MYLIFFVEENLFLAIFDHLEPLCIVLAASLKSTQDQPTISTTNNAGVRRHTLTVRRRTRRRPPAASSGASLEVAKGARRAG